MKTQTLCIYKLTKVIIVSKDKNYIFAAFQIVVPSLKSFNNSQKLLLVDFVPYLYQNHFWCNKSYRMLLTNFGLGKIGMIIVGYVIRKSLIWIIQSHLT